MITLGSYQRLHLPYWVPFSHKKLTIGLSEAMHHFHIMGLTRSGKSRLGASIALDLINAGHAVIVIDPHGSLSRLILYSLIAQGFFDKRTSVDRLLYLDIPGAAKEGRYLPFNLLTAQTTPDGKLLDTPEERADHILRAMLRTWPNLDNGVAPYFEKFVRYGTKLLITNSQPLTQLGNVTVDDNFRNRLLKQETSPAVMDFWKKEFAGMPERMRWEQTASMLSRIDILNFDAILRESLSQPMNILNFRTLMDNNVSVLINLKMRSFKTKKLYGSLMVSAIQQAIESREDMGEYARNTPVWVVIDEFQNFTDSNPELFNDMLSQTAKFDANLVLLHQYLGQLHPGLYGALGQARYKIFFEVGREDAKLAAPVLGRVDPESVRTDEEEGATTKSTSDQWEEITQSLQDQWPRHATITMPRKKKWWFKFFPHPPRREEHITSPYLPTPRLEPSQIEEVERYYRLSYFLPERVIVPPVKPKRAA